MSQKPHDSISAHVAIAAFVKYFGGSGNGVVTIGSYFRSFNRFGFRLNAPRNSNTAVKVLGLDMDSQNIWVLWIRKICCVPVDGPKAVKASAPYHGIVPFIPSLALRLRSYNWPTARDSYTRGYSKRMHSPCAIVARHVAIALRTRLVTRRSRGP